MFIYNICSKCGKKIKIRRPEDEFLQKVLEKSETAVCNRCDPASVWKRIEIEAIFTREGYTIYGTVIKANKQNDFFTLTIKWRKRKITFLSVQEIIQKAWEKSVFPTYIKNVLNEIYDEYVMPRLHKDRDNNY